MKKTNLVQLFRILVAVLFIFSAISKILSLPFFDGLVAKLLIGKDYYEFPVAHLFVQFFTRSLIALELFLGVAVMQRKYLKKIVLPTLFGVLLLFTIHLFYEGITDKFIGGNCGCFGDLVPMDNLESIIKNVIAMFMVWFIWANYSRKSELRFRSWVFPLVVGLVTFATLMLTVEKVEPKRPLVVYDNKPIKEESTVDSTNVTNLGEDTLSSEEEEVKELKEQHEQKKTSNTKIKQEETKVVKPKAETKPQTIFSGYTDFVNGGGGVDLDKGRKMICMFSLTCGHCQEAYKNICQMADQGGFPPIYMFLYGDSDDQLEHFFNQAGCQHPYIFIKDYIEFERLLQGNDFPRILDRIDGENKKEWTLENYTKESLAEHFGLEAPQEEGNGLGF